MMGEKNDAAIASVCQEALQPGDLVIGEFPLFVSAVEPHQQPVLILQGKITRWHWFSLTGTVCLLK